MVVMIIRYVDWKDYLLMIMGVLGVIGDGMFINCILFFVSWIMNSLGFG